MIQLDFSKPLTEIIQHLQAQHKSWVLDILNFVEQWNNESESLEVQTSGTTGKAKHILVQKDWMRYSASNTISYFGLTQGQTALLALSPHFIAGKMMLVRAIEAKLKLWICPPNDISILNNPIQIDFCPLVPLQAEKYLNQLHKITLLLLGGAPVSEALEHKLQKLPIQVYQSFAMTETLSHFAIRNISNQDLFYTIFETINFGVNEHECLWIEAPKLGQEFIQTTDVVELVDRGFIWKQRSDFVINSGGIKFNPEVLEKKCDFLAKRGWNFIFSARPDLKLGHKLVLVVEQSSIDHVSKQLQKVDFNLEYYSIPKQLYLVQKLPRTSFSQKVRRLEYELIFEDKNVISVYDIL